MHRKLLFTRKFLLPGGTKRCRSYSSAVAVHFYIVSYYCQVVQRDDAGAIQVTWEIIIYIGNYYCQVAQRDDAEAIQVLFPLISSESMSVATTAGQALENVVSRGNSRV